MKRKGTQVYNEKNQTIGDFENDILTYNEQIENAELFLNAKKSHAKIKMKFKDAPIGARFIFEDDGNIYVKIHSCGDGLTVQWNGNIQGHQSYGCWVDNINGIDLETEIELI